MNIWHSQLIFNLRCGKYYVSGIECWCYSFVIWFIIGCSIAFMAIISTNPKTFVHFFSFHLHVHITTQVLLIVMCTFHGSPKELENLGKLMVVCIVGISI